MSKNITKELLQELFEYIPDTGVFKRRVSTSNSVKIGDVAGGVGAGGYVRISVNGKQHYAHRLAWVYMTGAEPDDIDHINGNRSDNRWSNLRSVQRATNLENQRRAHAGSISGLLGVHWNKSKNKWHAKINVNRITHRLGYFATKEQAHAAYVEAKRRLHVGCTI